MGVFFKLSAVFVFQCVLAIIFYELFYLIYENLFGDIKPNLNWGITLYFATYFYLVICLLTTISNFLFGCRKFWIIIFLYVLFFINYAQHITYTPYRTGLMLISALLGFFIPLLLDKIIFLKKLVGNQFYLYRKLS
jgi:hypothetical protein